MSAVRALAVSATTLVLLLAGLVVVADGPRAGSPPAGGGRDVPFLPEPGGAQDGARIRSGLTDGGWARALHAAAAVPTSPLTRLHPWTSRGPSRIGGRITDLAWDPTRQVLVVASASGGLWRTDAAGMVLRPAWPVDATPAVGAVAVLADGTWLAGTGEANAGGGSTTFGGTGLYRSTDAGVTWVPSGLEDSGTIARVVGHPTDPDVAWVAAGGNLFRAGGSRGVYRTDDGGRTWAQVLAPPTPTSGGADIALDPADPDHLLASTWDRQRTPSVRRYGGRGSGLHASVDGGLTWRRVTDGIPGFGVDAGRIAVALSPADPDVGYAVVTRGDGRADGLYRSDDAGSSWRLVNDGPLYTASQFIFGWWFSKVFPAPDDPDRVLVPGLTLLESTDGGATFAVDRQVHADHHALVWHPEDPSTAWLGSDAGLYTSTAGGATGSWQPATAQPFTQAYDVAVSPATPDRLAAGFQDIGCRTAGADDRWVMGVGCGDGLVALPHPDRAGEVILCGQYGRCWLTVDGRGAARLPMPQTARAAWGAPLVRLPGDPDGLRFAGERVMASDDGGQTWRPMSGDLTRGASPDPDYPYGTVTELLPVDADGQDLLAGTDDGLLWRTTDGGQTWVLLLDGHRWITGLAAAEGGHVLVAATSGFFGGEAGAHVRRSDDGGATWRDIAAGLPDAPVNDVALTCEATACRRAAALLVATDVGLFAAWDWATAEQPTWRRVGEGLPQSPVMALDVRPDLGLVTAATFGRGIWQTRLATIERHAGTDRYATAVAVLEAATADRARTAPAPSAQPPARAPEQPARPPAQAPSLSPAQASTPSPVHTVVIASGTAPADALGAAALVAGLPGWALLLSDPVRLPAPTAEVLAAIRPDRVLLVGGRTALDEQVLDEVQAAAGDTASVTRVAGPDRHATAAALADLAVAARPDGHRIGTVLLATDAVPHDALAGGALAAATDGVLLLTGPTRLPRATADALAALQPARVVALGGRAAVGEAVLDAAAEAAGGATADRIAGADRVHTAALVAQAALEARPSLAGGTVWLAGTTGVADALAAGATGRPVLLVGGPGSSPSGAGVPPSTAEALGALGPVRLRVAGGAAVVPDGTLDALRWG